jgi:hypothetical protein
MRSLALATAVLVTLLPGSAHVSQVFPEFQTLESLSASPFVLLVEPATPAFVTDTLPHGPGSKPDLVSRARWTVLEVLRAERPMAKGAVIRVARYHESFDLAMSHSISAGMPTPSVAAPMYQGAASGPDGRRILFLGGDPATGLFGEVCIGSSESADSLARVRKILRPRKR